MEFEKEIALLVFGLTMLALGLGNLTKIFIRKKWFTGQARIVDTRVIEETNTHTVELSDFTPPKSFTNKSYTTVFAYEYKVDGVLYRASNIYSASLLPSTLSDTLPFTDNSVHTIWYDINDPKKSFLKHSNPFASIFLCLVGLTALYVSAMGWNFLVSEIKSLVSMWVAP